MQRKVRAVYYCRVSTDDENQATSMINQKQESARVIQENGWELVDRYIER